MRSILYQGLTATLLLGALISVGALARGEQARDTKGPKLGEAAPDFALSNLEGKRVSLKDFHGKKKVALVFYPALFRAGG